MVVATGTQGTADPWRQGKDESVERAMFPEQLKKGQVSWKMFLKSGLVKLTQKMVEGSHACGGEKRN